MKKRKNALTKAQRDAILARLGNSPVTQIATNPAIPQNEIIPQIKINSTTSPVFSDTTTLFELKRIAILMSLIIALLILLIVLDFKTTYLNQLGSIITYKIGL